MTTSINHIIKLSLFCLVVNSLGASLSFAQNLTSTDIPPEPPNFEIPIQAVTSKATTSETPVPELHQIDQLKTVTPAQPISIQTGPQLELEYSHANCTCKDQQKLDKAASKAHKGLFYMNNFDYMCNQCYNSPYLGDSLKNRSLGNGITYDIGGEYRIRFHNEQNLRGRHFTGGNDDFLLHRTRFYVDARAGNFRFYGEAIDATSNGHSSQPRGIEVNRFDALNLFGDYTFWSDCCNELTLRGGRQELLYGAQRLVSPLNWSNTRRTFDGAKVITKTENWDTDFFWTRPVRFGQHVPHDHNFDAPNEQEEFAGIYAKNKCLPGTNEFYYLRLADYSGTVTGEDTVNGDSDFNTLGVRLGRKWCDWSLELEAAYQFGDFSNDNISAGMVTLGASRAVHFLPWDANFAIYYDWASGDSDPTDGTHGTFNQLFPLGHKYFGFIDAVGRQNIQDLNLKLVNKICPNVKFLIWWHMYHLQKNRDALYNVGGAPIFHDPTGAAGKNVGHEIDLVLNWQVTPRVSAAFGYSHFFAGSYFDHANIQGGPAGLAANGANGNDIDFFYTQLIIKF